jgi:hypothetical protein
MSTPTPVPDVYTTDKNQSSLVESASVLLRRQHSFGTHRASLTPFQARRIKRNLVIAYCEGQISQAAVDHVFEKFPELRGA